MFARSTYEITANICFASEIGMTVLDLAGEAEEDDTSADI